MNNNFLANVGFNPVSKINLKKEIEYEFKSRIESQKKLKNIGIGDWL